jgi:hypothetical protein
MLTTILHLNLVMLIDDNKLISIQQLQVVEMSERGVQ